MAESFRRRSMNRFPTSAPRAEAPSRPNASCPALLRRLQAVDFSLADTVLYLDAYPHSEEALAYYHKLLSEREALTKKLADSCRRPITCLDNTSKDTWLWTDGPWPWEPQAN